MPTLSSFVVLEVVVMKTHAIISDNKFFIMKILSLDNMKMFLFTLFKVTLVSESDAVCNENGFDYVREVILPGQAICITTFNGNLPK